MHTTYPQTIDTVEGLPPAADAGGRAGKWVSLKNTGRAIVKMHVSQLNAAPVTLTINQAQDTSGTGSKALGAAQRIWANPTYDTADTPMVRQTDAVSFTTDAGLHSKLVMFEIDPALLDVANGFRCIQAVTSASNAANITEIEYILYEQRYKQTLMPSAMTT